MDAEDVVAMMTALVGGLSDETVAAAALRVAGVLGPAGDAGVWQRSPQGWEPLAGPSSEVSDEPVPARWTQRATDDGSLLVAAATAPSDTVAVAAAVMQTVARHERLGRQLDALVGTSPDAIVVVDRQGRIRQANQQAQQLFGYPPRQLRQLTVDDLVPDALRGHHAELRAGYHADPTTRPMAAGTDLHARHADGSLVPVDIALTSFAGPDGPYVAAFVRDATPRRQMEAARRRTERIELRRRQALELNDTVVQGLIAILWAQDAGHGDEVRARAQQTLAAARTMMTDLLAEHDEPLGPGELVRDRPAASGPARPSATAPRGAIRVVIADDAADLRLLLRASLERDDRVHVVGEATDGREAIAVTLELRPDVLLLDVAMPGVDGFEAAVALHDAIPETRLLMLSGYPAEAMREQALAAGAVDYLEKTADLDAIRRAILEHGSRGPAHADS